MTIADYDGVYSLWTRVKGMGLNDIDDSREGIGKYLDRNPSTSFVARAGGVIIGVILAGHDGRRGTIYHTAVDENYRGTGVGKALVKSALDALRNEGITKVFLVAFSDNEIGNAFWESAGFHKRNDLTYRDMKLVDMTNFRT